MDVLDRTPPKADHRYAYGTDRFQFGDLWLPKTAAPAGGWPVVVFIHGGWWQAQYDLAYTGFLADALRKVGIAVWSLEYRRIGNAGGGWPGTFQDVAAGFEFVRVLREQYPLNLERVVAAGHSAGGHLAFWVAGRQHVPESSPLAQPKPALGVHGVVSLAGAVGLAMLWDLSVGEFAHSRRWVASLMGGGPKEVPDRYAAGDPGALLPLGVPQWLVQGTEDSQIPPDLAGRWKAAAAKTHDMPVDVKMLAGAGHFDIVDPQSDAWAQVEAVFRKACFG